VRKPDSLTQRLKDLVDCWRDVPLMSDERLAELVRDDAIDILVDLTMHMSGNRLGVFACKPAPVHVSWLAYPAARG
jgi:predicted O-linked N-acetylglucosamine transferase (SPINDLY family)